MSRDLSCNVIKDLLPSYIDGIASEDTNNVVKEHIEFCEECKEAFQNMSFPEEKESQKEKKEINFLKSVKKKHIIVTAFLITGILLFVAAALGCNYYVENYVKGIAVSADEISCEIKVDGKEFWIEGRLLDSSRGFKSILMDCDNNGVVTLKMESAHVSSNYHNEFIDWYQVSNMVTCIYIGGVPVWDNGIAISEATARVFEKKHLYIGDMPANSESADALGVYDTLGSFTNFLRTSKEPYIWTIYLKNDYKEDDIEYYEYKMRYYACILIATIGNLDTVVFDYSVNGEKRTTQMSEKDADKLYKSSVKEAAQTPRGLQKLMDML